MTSHPNCLSLKSRKGEIFKLPNTESLDFKSQVFNSMSETFPISCSNCNFIWKAEHPPLFEILLKNQVLQ